MTDGEGRWLSYDDLAEARHIDRQSAFRLASRHHWPKRKSNAGRMTVLVPNNYLQDTSDDMSSDVSRDMSYDTYRTITALREQLEQVERSRAADMASFRADLEHERKRAEVDRVAAAEREVWLRSQIEALTAASRREPLKWRNWLQWIRPVKGRE